MLEKKKHVVGNKSVYRNDKQDTVNGNIITRIRDTGFNNEKFNSDRELNNSQRSTDAVFYTNKKRSITVLGDSIVKDVKPFKMRRMMNKNERLYVKCFSGVSINDMLDNG